MSSLLDKKFAHVAHNNVICILKREMIAGLSAREIKPKTPIYEELVDAINAPRISLGLRPLAAGARDNYMTRIRKFVKGKGEAELDLFGNVAQKNAQIPKLLVQLDSEVAEYFADSDSVNQALRSLIRISKMVRHR